MSKVNRSWIAAASGLILATAASSVVADAGKEWTMYSGDYANTRYSVLDQINTKNVGKLRVAWIRSLGTLDSQQSAPLVIGDTMFVTSSLGPRYVYALNAKDGSIIWKYEPELPNDFMSTVCCGPDNRGVAYANGRVFVTRLDAKMVALDAKTGKELWSTTLAEYKKGHAITSPPLIVKDLVVTGYAGGELGVRGALQAYKQDTGEMVWKTYTIPGPGEAGFESWKGDSWKTGGGSTWYVGSYDPTRPFGPWILRIATNRAFDRGRRKKVRATEPLHEDRPSGRPGPDTDLERAMLRERLDVALARLPPRQRVAVTMFDAEGYSHSEIADVLGVPEGTVRSDVFHARRALRTSLTMYRGGEG